MLDWGERIDDLSEHLMREHGVEDRLAIEILLAALAPCPRTPAVWLILETNWFSRNCLDGWFSFGSSWAPCALSRLRARSPWREIEAEMQRYLDTPDNRRLFIECDFERYPLFNRLTQAHYLLQRTPRIRTMAKRSDDPLRGLDREIEERRSLTLKAAAQYVIEDRARLRPEKPPRFIAPPDFLYYLELVQKLAPWYRDWKILVEAFAVIAVRRAWLYGRTETDETDNQAMARAITDSIPPWIAKALQLLMDGPSKTETVEKHMRLEEATRRSGHGAHRELVRLHRAGILKWNKLAVHWTIAPEHFIGIRTALQGCAFSAEKSVSA